MSVRLSYPTTRDAPMPVDRSQNTLSGWAYWCTDASPIYRNAEAQQLATLPVRLTWAVTGRGAILTEASRTHLRRLRLPEPPLPAIQVRPRPTLEPPEHEQLTLLPTETEYLVQLYSLHLVRSDDGEPASPGTAYFRAYRDFLRHPTLEM